LSSGAIFLELILSQEFALCILKDFAATIRFLQKKGRNKTLFVGSSVKHVPFFGVVTSWMFQDPCTILRTQNIASE
jgi:hypothetical protein